ncbi:hypothetical protein CEXT_351131 [Caerostris extrusa]|uniref:Uncharacterized protein n=1 Tax=Caerostris extrusa TaxID=172846 RepID=A0AAV4UPT9_CAEEX|nr:hypothetical protein CEXT_351131 [Caerostris extrusa]
MPYDIHYIPPINGKWASEALGNQRGFVEHFRYHFHPMPYISIKRMDGHAYVGHLVAGEEAPCLPFGPTPTSQGTAISKAFNEMKGRFENVYGRLWLLSVISFLILAYE